MKKINKSKARKSKSIICEEVGEFPNQTRDEDKKCTKEIKDKDQEFSINTNPEVPPIVPPNP